MALDTGLLSLDNPVFTSYLFYCALLVLKVLFMVPLTARQRISKRVVANPEDAGLKPNLKIKFDDPDIERVRRAHLNDLENIPVFFLAALGYMLTNPSVWLATMLMRAFVISRATHTFVYAIYPTQPARAIAFTVGYAITVYMAIVTVMKFC